MVSIVNKQKSQIKSPNYYAVASNVLRCEATDGTIFFVAHENGNISIPGNGGMRLKYYSNEQEALSECQQLSQGMALKHRVYNTGFTGAKLVAMGTPQYVNKQMLLRAVASVLNQLEGAVYTGCDLNTTIDDMEYLHQLCPYVLAAIESSVDPNLATAYGVFGSIESIFDRNLQGKTFLVHGVGNVGSALAKLLMEAGSTVFTYDIVSERAQIPGCQNLSSQKDWWNIPCDVFVPCSTAGLITDTVAKQIHCHSIVGSANLAITMSSVHDILASRGILWIPEAVSSAGAILCDSVEHYNPSTFCQISPNEIYSFVRKIVREKTKQLLTIIRGTGCYSTTVMSQILESPTQLVCGQRFHEWG